MKPIASAQAALNNKWLNCNSFCKNNHRFSSNSNNSRRHSNSKLLYLLLYLCSLKYSPISQTYLNQQLILELVMAAYKISLKATYRIRARVAGLHQIPKCLLIRNLDLKLSTLFIRAWDNLKQIWTLNSLLKLHQWMEICFL
jgi:hypothetical protein